MRAAHKPQPRQDGGKGTGCRAGRQGDGEGEDTTTAVERFGGGWWGSLGDTPAAPPAPAPPAAKRTASLHRPLCSCPYRAPAPAARVLLPPARGQPAATLGPLVMGYLGVGLLSLPLQEPELLLLLSEEVP